MRVVSLHRYPVKSMQGQPLEAAALGELGIVGDRSHALVDVATGVVLTGRLDPPLLFATGVLGDDGRASIRLPDGTVTNDAAMLTRWIGRPVRLVGPSAERSTYEIRIDAEDEASDIVSWQGPADRYHDSRGAAVSILATGDIGRSEPRRFRANVIVDAATADELVGRDIQLGTARLHVTKPIERCVMVTRPQPGGIERDLDVLRTIGRERDMLLGVGALVTSAGVAAVGDGLTALEGESG